MSEVPLPHRHEESPPRRQTFVTGRTGENGKLVTFPASAKVEHDRNPADPDARPSDRIVPGTPDSEMGDALAQSNIRRALERGLCAAGNGTLDRTLIDSVSASITEAVRAIAHRQCCDLAYVIGTTEGELRAEISELRAVVKVQKSEIAQLRADIWDGAA